MIQITNRGRMWWLLKDKKVIGFASTYKIALAKAMAANNVKTEEITQ